MKTFFFITGLPRSRTAWLANFLSYGEMFCFHDSMRELDHVDELKSVFDRAEFAKAVGHSDPMNLLFQNAMIRNFPDAKWVLIERDKDCVERAAKRAFDRSFNADYYLRKVADLREKPNVLTVRFEDLDGAKALEIGRWLCPGWTSPEPRNEMLERMNVQLDPAILRRDLAKLETTSMHILKHIE